MIPAWARRALIAAVSLLGTTRALFDLDVAFLDYMVAGAVLCAGVAYELARRHADAERAETARNDEQMAFALAAAHIGTWEISEDGSESWSPVFRDLLGVAEAVPASTELFHSVVVADDRAAVEAADTDMIGRPGRHEFEFRIERGGEIRSLLTRGRCVVDEHTGIRRVHGVTIDITERKREEEERRTLEHQLTQAQKLETLGRLAGGVAHDFNNVLVAINGYAELASRLAEGGVAPLAELDEITAAAARAAALTRQLLAFSRKQVLKTEVLDLNAIILETEGLLTRVISENIQLEHALHREHVRVVGDRTQIEQVLLNLVVNARDAMPGGGRVTIEVDEVDVGLDHALDLEPGRFALLAVSDSGVGIDADSVAQIFEPFFTTKTDGTGLGLATVYGIVRQSGGTIWVYSEPGCGATFKIYLPLADRAQPAVSAPSLPAATRDVNGERVLLVEDDEQVRAIVQRMLAARGFDVTAMADPDLAVAAASTRQYDVLLSDLVMPNRSGSVLARELRELQPNLAVILMSGYSDDAVRLHGVLDPDVFFIEKPFSSDELVRRIQHALELRAVAA